MECIFYHTAKVTKDVGVHYLLFHTVSGVWGKLVIWTQDCVYNNFSHFVWESHSSAQKLVMKGELYKGLNLGEGLWATAGVRYDYWLCSL